jgi:hypothetical protein
MYVSVTDLKIKAFWQWPVFFWYALPALRQAKRAPGVLLVDTCSRDGVPYTLTVWQDRESMRDFLTSGAHLKAMRAIHSFGTARTHGYLTERLPTWEEAMTEWHAHGSDH